MLMAIALIEQFPEANILATPEVVAKMAEAILRDGIDAFQKKHQRNW
jgi:hypothetical protein